jgi:DtxR family Mn-dependent transcriptional regulator
LLTLGEEGMRLTPSGERYALNVIRAHRLWEQHLAEKTGVAENEWHRRAERRSI